jgi:diguanylate cyclase (GGDEF)-like protein/PAS domain S-box-containing protein
MSNGDDSPLDAPETEAQVRQTLLEYQAILDNASVGIMFTRDRKFVHYNEFFAQMVGWPRHELVGKPTHLLYVSIEDFQKLSRVASPVLSSGRPLELEWEIKRRDGSTFLCRFLAKAIDPADSSKGTIFIAEDVTERKRIEFEREEAQQRVLFMAHHDTLTDLPNRVLLQDRIRQAVAQAHRNRMHVAVIFIDLDHFKHINDSLGHQVGDHLLQAIARTLQQCLREGDTLARLGGDEFVLSLPLLAGSNEAALVAQKILDVLEKPFLIDGHDLSASASMGISLYPEDGEDVETLMRAADTAMYHAKDRGRSNYQFFTPALNTMAQHRLELGNQLRRTLARNEFVLHYQPQVDISSGVIFAAEALLRYAPAGESVPTSGGEFISIAEETGLIAPLGEWVLRQACQQLRQWRDTGFPELRIAVNLSPRQLNPADFPQMVWQILAEFDLPASALDLEITESLLLQKSEDNVVALKRLSDMGIQLSVDDFGTGYAGLAYLQRFPVHALKIDQSFVRGVGKDKNDTALVSAIIAIARSLHLKILAEGVETEEQAAFLLSHGCPAAQGFLYSKAVSADDFIALLRKPRLRPGP